MAAMFDMIKKFRQPLLAAFVFFASLAPAHLFAQVPQEAEDIRGPKPLVEIPQPEQLPVALWLAIAGGVLLLAIAWLIWERHSRKQKLKSPPEVALATLAELEMKREDLTAEVFANRAAQVVRQYISDCFGLAAPRRTTEEFLRDLSEGSSLVGEGDHLRTFLKSCDLAKFAGSRLDTKDRVNLLETAREFVAATTPKPKGKQP
jgi:hypothetical protein